jgi:hypothetical protein
MNDEHEHPLDWDRRPHRTPYIEVGDTAAVERLEEGERWLAALSAIADRDISRRSWRREVDALELAYALADLRRLVGDVLAGLSSLDHEGAG